MQKEWREMKKLYVIERTDVADGPVLPSGNKGNYNDVVQCVPVSVYVVCQTRPPEFQTSKKDNKDGINTTLVWWLPKYTTKSD